MDVNHETYNNNLRKIAFILSFMTAGAAAAWKAQFIDNAYTKPTPANLNDRLGTYTQFRKDLMEAFSLFDSVGDALDELRSLRRKKTDVTICLWIHRGVSWTRFFSLSSFICILLPLVSLFVSYVVSLPFHIP
jgi:hypothetical protein